VRGFDDIVHRGQHNILDLQQPFLYSAARLTRRNRLVELDLLHLAAVHADDVEVAVELEVVDPFEALLEMRLDARRIFRFRQNLQHLVVRQEKKPKPRRLPAAFVNLRHWQKFTRDELQRKREIRHTTNPSFQSICLSVCQTRRL